MCHSASLQARSARSRTHARYMVHRGATVRRKPVEELDREDPTYREDLGRWKNLAHIWDRENGERENYRGFRNRGFTWTKWGKV